MEPHPRFGLTRETPAGRAAEFSRRPAGLLPTAPVCQPHPVGLLQQGNGLLSRESAPFSRTSIIVDENADSSAAWNWRRRVDASNGESGGRDVQCDGDNHGSRAAALNHRHSSFCYTCCPYAAYLAQNSVERSDERLNKVVASCSRNDCTCFVASHSQLSCSPSWRMKT